MSTHTPPEQQEKTPQRPTSLRRPAASWLERAASYSWRLLVVVVALAVVTFVLVQLRLVVLPALVALFISTLFSPPVSWLRDRGWPSLVATTTVILVTVVVFGVAITLLARPVAAELDELGSTLQQGSEQVTDWLAQGPLGLSQAQMETLADRVGREIRASGGALWAGVFSGAVQAIELVTGGLLALVLAFFFLKDGPAMFSWVEDQFPERQRAHVREIGDRVWATMGSYLRGLALIAFVDAALIGAALAVIGVPLVVPLMVLTFLGGFLPFVGAFAAGLVATLVALVANGPLDAALVAASILVIQQVEGNVLQPVVMSRSVNLHPVVILLSLTAGAVLGGIAGAFLAVPLTATAVAVASYARSAANTRTES